MNLSTYQENEYLQSKTNLIHRVINKFLAKASRSGLDRDDLFQECSIVLLLALRKAESIEYLDSHFPFLDMVNAMSKYVLGQQTLSYPKRTSSLKEFAKTFQAPEDIAIVDAEIAKSTDDFKDADTRIDVERYAASLPPQEREILSMRLDGYGNTQIAEKKHIDCRIVNQAAAKFRRQMRKTVLC